MRELTFRVTEQEARILIAGLGKLPAEIVFDLIVKLRTQEAEQSKPKEPEAVSDGQDA